MNHPDFVSQDVRSPLPERLAAFLDDLSSPAMDARVDKLLEDVRATYVCPECDEQACICWNYEDVA